ncbi:MAG TPA: iron-sulfur cluster repair di-iron protein [Candidatus Angelobacter sp.]|nr:iron-sulfur cluster repair di-iron protein [Candidatus Angelobacter sp.]
MNLDSSRTVRELAIEIPNATRTFEKLGIDYCCGGSQSLDDACRRAKVPVESVLRELGDDGQPKAQGAVPDFNRGALGELIGHILSTHHAYVKKELPRLHQLLNKVVSVHGRNHPELSQIQQTFQAMAAELSSHMMKEEHILFPYIVALENAVRSGSTKPNPAFGPVSNPVRMMELEHDAAGAALREISALSSNYTPPPGACFSYNTLYTALKEFEADLHQHVHLENNILFPRSIEMEKGA